MEKSKMKLSKYIISGIIGLGIPSSLIQISANASEKEQHLIEELNEGSYGTLQGFILENIKDAEENDLDFLNAKEAWTEEWSNAKSQERKPNFDVYGKYSKARHKLEKKIIKKTLKKHNIGLEAYLDANEKYEADGKSDGRGGINKNPFAHLRKEKFFE